MKPLKTNTYGKMKFMLDTLDFLGFERNSKYDEPKGTPGHGYYRERTSQNIGDEGKIFKDKAILYGNDEYATICFEYDFDVSNM